ncbi:lipopolysaccharide-induced tumor necrosis factor-alpha factor homolog [Drosophila mauritiana]|uniref:Lipopolysaccharide-induced tumor necrosis factor-alpha factor homolog n=1 Tax=Drosophila mauritiana TaxID=7226 RepID=A0A6P8JMX5_DROMA|nr:lipopolysaccharide-induced tumor necrosis factor-alpha factor homolog [Drosophila mauritiana]
MDQKRAMLYPQVDFNTPTAPSPTPTRELGNPIANGLPIEAPPSYDVAVSVPVVPAVSAPAIAPARPPPVVVVEQPAPQPPTVVPTDTLHLGPNRSRVLCPACGANKTTRMTHTANSRTHMVAGLLCLVGFCCCACFVPYCMNSCRTGNHYCRKCNTFLGAYNPKGMNR